MPAHQRVRDRLTCVERIIQECIGFRVIEPHLAQEAGVFEGPKFGGPGSCGIVSPVRLDLDKSGAQLQLRFVRMCGTVGARILVPLQNLTDFNVLGFLGNMEYRVVLDLLAMSGMCGRVLNAA